MAHTASHPAYASALLARNAPVVLPAHRCAPNTVLKRLRASGATKVTSVTLATRAAPRPQSRRTAPAITAPIHSAANPDTRHAVNTRPTPAGTTRKAATT